jgi:expansin (peptidoglycan-binding protein)
MKLSAARFGWILKIWGVILLAVALLVQSSPALVMADDTYPVYLPLILRTEPVNTNPIHEGIATYYYATGGGACSFDPSPDDLMVAAMNADDYYRSTYGQAAYCGAYVNVIGRKGSVVVRIVDLCPGCAADDLDLSQEAFAEVDNLSAGRVPITWQVVSPALSRPIAYHFKSGSNQWWMAVQVRNHRNPIESLEYRATGSSDWINVPRTSYNYFVPTSGMGAGPYDFRVTDWYGNVLTDSAIPLVADGTIAGSAQFPAGP